MERCEQCGEELLAGASFCSQCGTPAPAAPPGSEGREAVYPLLARANLLRMRGRWQEAAELCREAIRLDPRNPSVHSLLGDIYENQGLAPEALRCYDLALSLNPASEADAAKKARLQELLEARRRRAEWQAASATPASRLRASIATREVLQRVLLTVGAGVCAIILVTAVVVSAGHRVGRATQFTPAPHVWPPPKRMPLPLARSEREHHVLKEMTGLGEASSEWSQAVELTIDPRTEVADLKLLATDALVGLPSLGEIRERIRREAYRMARAVYQKDHALKSINVRVYGERRFSSRSPEQDLLFTATLQPENLLLDPTATPPTTEELERFFANPWWNPALPGS